MKSLFVAKRGPQYSLDALSPFLDGVALEDLTPLFKLLSRVLAHVLCAHVLGDEEHHQVSLRIDAHVGVEAFDPYVCHALVLILVRVEQLFYC